MVQTQDELVTAELKPVQTLLEITGAYALPRCLHVVADLGVADVRMRHRARPRNWPRR
jgi:hypothetical protein